MVDLKYIGRQLKTKRKQRGLTLEGLEGLAGVARARISQIENARRPQPTFDTIARIARALDVSLDELAGRGEAGDKSPGIFSEGSYETNI